MRGGADNVAVEAWLVTAAAVSCTIVRRFGFFWSSSQNLYISSHFSASSRIHA